MIHIKDLREVYVIKKFKPKFRLSQTNFIKILILKKLIQLFRQTIALIIGVALPKL